MDVREEDGGRGNSSVFTPHTPQPLPRPGSGVSYTQGIWDSENSDRQP